MLFTATLAAVLVMAGIGGGAWAQNPDRNEVALHAAMKKETVDGDLKGAIEAYKKLAQSRDHAIAAKALVRMGECYEKLGDAEARKAYERVVRDFGDQKDLAERARTRLAALERAGGLSHPPGITLRKAWTLGRGPGWIEGTPTPDGRYHCFTDWETGDLAVRDLVTGQSRRLTNKGTWKDSDEFAEACAISGDGRQVAFSWSTGDKEELYELRVMGMDGSPPRVVFRDKEVAYYVQPFQWTADGKHILTTLVKRRQYVRLVLIPAAGGPVRVVKTLADWAWYASLSPDGRFLVYDQPGPGGHDIFLLSVEGGQEIPLVRHPADDFAPIWMPDGKRVLFVSDRTGTTGFWTIHVVDGKPQGSPELLKNGAGGRWIRPNGFTRQGSFYYYSSGTGTHEVYVAEVDPAAGKVLRQPAPVAARFLGSNSGPSWSPDGRRLAYYSQRSDTHAAVGGPTLVIHSVETDEERDVPVTLVQLPYPVRWFPDGKSVLVSAWDSPKRDLVALYRVDIQTGDHRLVRNPLGGGAVSELSPDGKTLFFFSPGEPKLRGGVISRDIETGQEREIARIPDLAGGGFPKLTVSPDSKYLALRLPVDGDQWTALRLVPATGGEWRELCRFPQSETAPGCWDLTWTPDGRNLLIVRRTGKDGMPELWRIPIAGGEPQRTGLSMKGMRLVAAHPDGRRIAFDNSGDDSGAPGEVWVLENFLAAAESKAVPGAK
jgi:Tol biopolymer transport system component